MLQGAFADAKQSADVPVMQPIRVFGLFSESLHTTFRKAQHLIAQAPPIGLRNNQILHGITY